MKKILIMTREGKKTYWLSNTICTQCSANDKYLDYTLKGAKLWCYAYTVKCTHCGCEFDLSVDMQDYPSLFKDLELKKN